MASATHTATVMPDSMARARAALLRNPTAVVFFGASLALILLAGFAELLAPYDPTRQHFRHALASPGTIGPSGVPFYLGTDEFGRDILSRLLIGARSSIGVALSAVTLGTIVGSAIGLVSGYFLGTFDLLMQRVMDSLLAIPTLLLAMVLMSAAGVSVFNLAIVVAITQVPTTNVTVRATVLGVREDLYVLAAVALGAPTWRILLRHVLPNVVAPIIVVATTRLGQAIVIAGSLSFLGFGVQPPTPDWGAMVNEARNALVRAPELALYPSLAITLTVLVFNLAGDTLRDILDPRLRAR